MLHRIWNTVAGYLRMFAIIVVAILLTAIFQPQFEALDAAIARNYTVLFRLALGTLMLGLLLFLVPWSYHMWLGLSYEPEDVDYALRTGRSLLARRGRRSVMASTPRGCAMAFDVEIRFYQIKRIVTSGAWRNDPVWLAAVTMICGGFLIVFGAFSLVVLHGPDYVKLLFGAAMIYAAGMTIYGFWRA